MNPQRFTPFRSLRPLLHGGVALFLGALLPGLLAPPLARAQDASDDSADKVMLNPVLKEDAAQRVTLVPVVRGENKIGPTTPTAMGVVPMDNQTSTVTVARGDQPATSTRAASQQPEDRRPSAPLVRSTPAERSEAPARTEVAASRPAPSDIETLLEGASNLQTREQLKGWLQHHINDPEVTEVLLRIAAISMEIGDTKDARAAFNAASGSATDKGQRIIALEGLHRAASAVGDLGGARAAWDELQELAPSVAGEPDLLASQAWAAGAGGEYEASDDLWSRVESSTTGDAGERFALEARLSRALSFELQGRSTEARQAYRELIDRHSGSPESRVASMRLEQMESPLIATAPDTQTAGED